MAVPGFAIMARWKFRGLDRYVAKLENLHGNADEHIKRAIYEGAGVVADRISASLGGVQTAEDRFYRKGQVQPGPKPDEKAAMIAAFGIAKMRKSGSAIQTKVGFGNARHGDVTVATLARRLESGTSFQKKQPVIRRAMHGARSAAEQAMKTELEKQIKKSMGG